MWSCVGTLFRGLITFFQVLHHCKNEMLKIWKWPIKRHSEEELFRVYLLIASILKLNNILIVEASLTSIASDITADCFPDKKYQFCTITIF